MVWHNISQLQNVSSVVSVTDYIAKTTDGIFFQALIVIIFVVILMALIRYGFVQAVAVASFLCWILSIYLVYLTYINFIYSAIFFVILLAAIVYMYVTKQ